MLIYPGRFIAKVAFRWNFQCKFSKKFKRIHRYPQYTFCICLNVIQRVTCHLLVVSMEQPLQIFSETGATEQRYLNE